MPYLPAAPAIDAQNPLYCPAFRAGRAKANIVHRRSSHRRSQLKFDAKVVVSSFSRLLCKSLIHDAKHAPQPIRKTRSQTNALPFNFAFDGDVLKQPSWAVSDSSSSSLSSASVSFNSRKSPVAVSINHRPRLKRKLSSKDALHRPLKLAKTLSISLDEPEEEASLICPIDFSKALGVDCSPPTANVEYNKEHLSLEDKLLEKIRTLEDFLYGPSIGPESPRGLNILIEKLDALLPGIRLKKRLSSLSPSTHQGVADYLAEFGFLNLRVMSILRTSEIRSLSLSNSLEDEDGLNIDAKDVLTVFSRPNSFIFLTQLSFTGTQIQDFDLVHIQHLPRLSVLYLDNTGIGNEAIYILTSLKRTLTYLTVAINPDVNNDAIPALILLTKLTYLSILDTNVDMIGLRRLAHTINQEGRIIDVEMPEHCEHYLDNLDSKYLVKLRPPLINRWSLCGQLSAAALKRNLAAHAACNPKILASGTKTEMKERLENILRMREDDLIVANMVFDESCPNSE
ncbi:hypothetical protein BDZ89DRAFT_1067141 [Hymenopellis radicata]|nr:hypothetical protein BDZ89DRAFT_1067141 [Hymenopellis radicata]